MNQSLSPRELLALKKEILSSLHCALPGIVESFDAAAGTAYMQQGDGSFRCILTWRQGMISCFLYFSGAIRKVLFLF